jgi:hypothetical protein
MELIDVYLQIDDEAYLKALSEGLTADSRMLRIFTGTAGDDDSITITDRETDDKKDNYLYVTEKEDDDLCHIFKYDDTRNIADKIREFYCMRHGYTDKQTIRPETRVVYFTSAEGGSGATSAAISSAELLNMIYGYRSIYIDASETEGSEKFLRCSSGMSASELLFRLKFTDVIPLSEYVSHGRYFDSLVMPFREIDSESGSTSLLSKLITCIEMTSSYDYIIIDSNGLSMLRDKNISELISCIVLLYRGASGCTGRIIEKITALEVPKVIKVYRGNIRGFLPGADEDDSEHALLISEEPSSFSNDKGKISIDLNGSYGEGITDLVMEIADAGTFRRCDAVLRRKAEVVH